MLSIAAAVDLKVMMRGYRKQKPKPSELGEDGLPAKKPTATAKELGHLRKGGKAAHPKVAKGRGAAARLIKPKAINAFAGKRRC